MEDIQQMFAFLRRSTDQLLREVIDLAYRMKGGIQYEDLMWRSPVERQAMYEYFEHIQKETERIARENKIKNK